MINRFNMLSIKSANQTLAEAALLPDPIFLYAPQKVDAVEWFSEDFEIHNKKNGSFGSNFIEFQIMGL